MYFQYGETETGYLKAKDKKLGDIIEQLGHINRTVHPDIFASLVNSIVAQQISGKAAETVWARLMAQVGTMDASHILAAGTNTLQSCGMSFKKAENIVDLAAKVNSGTFDLEAIKQMPDTEAIKALSSLKGIGIWTAEMMLLFCLERPDILSFGDFGIQKGLRMVYHHRKIDRKLFEKYRRRYSPYGSVASLYLWAVAGGAIPEMRDYAPKAKKS